MAGHGPWFALTRVSGDYGPPVIVGDGPVPADALAAGIAAIAPGLGDILITNLTVAQYGVKLQLEHMMVLHRSQVIAVSGVKALIEYEPAGPVRT
ncbi:MAG TPA: hypothetical protein VFJ58_13380 [Armatimonadota bacterium]|nr:hypothetical protein [Armatimonadota bacterium]